MIYVYDNGLDYSDHSVYFIESDWPNASQVEELLNSYGKYAESGRKGRVIGTSERIDWRVGENFPLTKMVQPHDLFTEAAPDGEYLLTKTSRWGSGRYHWDEEMVSGIAPELLGYLIDTWSDVCPASVEELAFLKANRNAACDAAFTFRASAR